jgi:hypothetical protein
MESLARNPIQEACLGFPVAACEDSKKVVPKATCEPEIVPKDDH